MAIGILALQGDVREHLASFQDLEVDTALVTKPRHLDGLSGIVLPGGESTTLSLLLKTSGLESPLGEALSGGMPAFGTCAGLVLLASTVVDGRADQHSYGLFDCTVRRNGYGRQRFSFETTLSNGTHGVFIRAPRVMVVGAEVNVLATLDGPEGVDPVAIREGNALATSFHPELTDDRSFHRLFSAMCGVGQKEWKTAVETPSTVVMP